MKEELQEPGKMVPEQPLVNNEKLFRALIENGQDVITLMNQKCEITYRSPSYIKVLGYTTLEMAQKTPFEDVYPDDIPVLKEMLQKMLSKPGAKVSCIWRQRHKNGNWIWLEGSGTNLLHDPAVRALVNNFRDITERKKIKDELTLANRELKRLFNTMDEVCYSAERNPPRLIQMSASCEKTYGYTAEEFFADVELWHKVTLPEDGPVLHGLFTELYNGLVARGEYRIRHKNGSIRWVSVNITPTLNAEGKLVRVDGVNRDITEKKEADEKVRLSEQRFKALIEKGNDAVAIISLDRTILYLSPSVYNILGYNPEELLGRSSGILLHPDEVPLSPERMKKMVEALPGRSFQLESRVKHKNGSWVWLSFTLTNETDDAAVGGIVANFHDITGSKKAMEEIDALNRSLEIKVQQRTQELEEANKLLESYNYSVAHDLKSPLRVISGFGKVLADTAKDRLEEKDKELLEVIISSSNKMSQLVSDLLHFSHVKMEKIRPKETDMDQLLKEVVELVKQGDTAPLANIQVHHLGTAFCDSRLLKQVWVNLVSNAVKYSKKSCSPQVEIGKEVRNGKTVYFVKDNGVGFNNEYADKLFEVFYRLHRGKEFEGTGVGLALAKSVVEHHHGKIWASGKVGEGATFWFYLGEKELAATS